MSTSLVTKGISSALGRAIGTALIAAVAWVRTDGLACEKQPSSATRASSITRSTKGTSATELDMEDDDADVDDDADPCCAMMSSGSRTQVSNVDNAFNVASIAFTLGSSFKRWRSTEASLLTPFAPRVRTRAESDNGVLEELPPLLMALLFNGADMSTTSSFAATTRSFQSFLVSIAAHSEANMRLGTSVPPLVSADVGVAEEGEGEGATGSLIDEDEDASARLVEGRVSVEGTAAEAERVCEDKEEEDEEEEEEEDDDDDDASAPCVRICG